MNLNPGMCPYIPTISKELLYQTNELIKSRFDINNVDRKTITFTWP